MTQSIYFGATNGTQGTELWRVDELGNVSLAADIWPGGQSSDPGNFTPYNGELYFTASSPALGFSLWKVAADGTIAPVSTVAAGASTAQPQHLAVANGKLYFTANGLGGPEPHVIGPDGIVRLVANINQPGGSWADEFTAVGDDVYFHATNDGKGLEIWKLAPDGTLSMVTELVKGPQSAYPSQLTAFGGTLYFTATTSTTGIELYRLRPDGTPGLALNISPHAGNSNPTGFTVFNGEMYFSATRPADGTELWKVMANGTVVQVSDLNPGPVSSLPAQFTAFNGSLYFAANLGASVDRELWRVAPDGSVLPVASINPTGSANPYNFTVFDGALYFVANDGTHGYELWKVGADGAVSLVTDLNPGAADSSPISLTATDSALYFSAQTAAGGRELWSLKPGGILTQVTDLVPGSGSSHFSPFFIGVHVTADPLIAPTITSNGGGAAASVSIAENKAAVTTITATDADGTAGALHYVLSGADAALFAIDAGGKLVFKSAPDFETPTDAGRNNIYDVTVTAIDADGLTDSQALSIIVTDVKGITWKGNGSKNSKTGTLEADTLRGKGGNDKLKGGGGKDTIDGGAGNDKLWGGEANDKLTGGSGRDSFVFNVALASAGIDKITDFSHADDTILLEDSVFAALGASVTSNEFVARSSGHVATKTSHKLIYDKSKGSLWYDADGKGSEAAVQIAQLGTTKHHPTDLSYTDFAIV